MIYLTLEIIFLKNTIKKQNPILMKKNVKSVVLNLVFLLIIGLWASTFGFAQAQRAETGVEIKPALIEDRVEPGKTFSSALIVSNVSRQAQTFYLIKRDITGVDAQGHPTFDDTQSSHDYQMSSWISLSADQITIPGGQSKQVPFSVNVPQTASPGGHFAIIFVSLQPVKPDTNGSSIGYQVGSILSLQIAGDVHETLQIREFRTDRSIYSTPEVKLITKVENSGNTLLKPYGPVEITDMFGRKVATLTMNETAAGIFPGSIREFNLTWHGGKLSLGRYQVVMGLSYGTVGSQTATATTSFWVLPLKIILPVIAVILLFILILYFGVKYYVRRKMNALRQTTAQLRKGGKGLEAQLLRSGPASSSRLVLITLVLLIVVIALLALLFVFFS